MPTKERRQSMRIRTSSRSGMRASSRASSRCRSRGSNHSLDEPGAGVGEDFSSSKRASIGSEVDYAAKVKKTDKERSTKDGVKRSLTVDEVKIKVSAAKDKNSGNTGVEGMSLAVPKSIELPSWQQSNWQLQVHSSVQRMALLFNCHTLSDVQFEIGNQMIPAHKLILSSSSTVFQTVLYQETPITSEMASPQPWARGERRPDNIKRITVVGMPFEAFFEFLSFVYTNQASITLSNVMWLINCADSFKVAGLTERCVGYMRGTLRAGNALRVLEVAQSMLLRAVMGNWTQAIWAERRARGTSGGRMSTTESHFDGSANWSRMGSPVPPAQMRLGLLRGAASSPSPASNAAMLSVLPRLVADLPGQGASAQGLGKLTLIGGSRRESMASMRSAGFSGSRRPYSDFAGSSDMSNESDCEVMLGPNKIGLAPFRGTVTEVKLSVIISALVAKVWTTIALHTDKVFESRELLDQSHATMRELLSTEGSRAPEILFFRALNEWAAKECERRELPKTASSKVRVIGTDMIRLIRFPTMTLEQIQWEVIPSGLLGYGEAQQVMYALSNVPFAHRGKHVPMSAFSSETRFNKGRMRRASGAAPLGGAQGSLVAAEPRQPVSSYRPVPGDNLDAVLACELLRSHLKRTSRPGKAPLTARLPKVATAIAVNKGSISARTAPQDRQPDPVHRDDDVGPTMNLCPRNEDPPAVAADFRRLCAGLYAFRDDCLLELLFVSGNAMAIDHGRPTDFAQKVALAKSGDVPGLRAALGLPPKPNVQQAMYLSTFLKNN